MDVMSNRLAILSPRMIQCLALLADSETYHTVSDLAGFVKTSKRTLFRELKDINGILRPYQLQIRSEERRVG